MVIVQVKDAEGSVLDWMVAKCEGTPSVRMFENSRGFRVYENESMKMQGISFAPSTNWSQGGPIMEELRRESYHSFLIENDGDNIYVFSWPSAHVFFKGHGKTLLIAAMRCYVTSKFGDTVEVPDELI